MTLFHRLYAGLTNQRFLKLFILPQIVFSLIALGTSARELIPILNLVVVALSVNVCVAFAPNVIDAIFSKRPIDKADLLSLGIFCSWFALVLRSAWSLTWRWLGEPSWLTNTDFTSYFIFMAGCGAVFHLLAPGSLKDSVPPLRWVKIGAWIAAAVLVGLLLVYRSSMQDDWKRYTTPNDRAATPSSMVQPL